MSFIYFPTDPTDLQQHLPVSPTLIRIRNPHHTKDLEHYPGRKNAGRNQLS